MDHFQRTPLLRRYGAVQSGLARKVAGEKSTLQEEERAWTARVSEEEKMYDVG